MQVLSAGKAAPRSLHSLCLDLKDSAQRNDMSMSDMHANIASGTRSAASTSKALAAFLTCLLSHTAASLESLALYIPHLRTPLPAMTALQHLTLHQDAFCTFSSLHVRGLPRLQSLALLQAPSVECDHASALRLDLGCLHELRAVYLVNQLPGALTLPRNCALHISGSCSRIHKLLVYDEPEWEKALMQVQSVCEDFSQGGGGRVVSQLLSVPLVISMPQSTLSVLTALKIACSRDVDFGGPISLAVLPALERLVLVGDGTVHFYFPASMHLKHLWVGHFIHFMFRFESAANFTSAMEDVCIKGYLNPSPSMTDFLDALRERGTPLVNRQLQGEEPVHVIEGSRYDTEAGQEHTCACQICLDCLVRRSCRPSELPSALASASF